jgi:phage shock protein A
MAAQDLDNLTRMLEQHDDELSEQQTQIVNLERNVAVLATIVSNLFAMCSSVPRYTEAQETAYKAVEEQLKSLAP